MNLKWSDWDMVISGIEKKFECHQCLSPVHAKLPIEPNSGLVGLLGNIKKLVPICQNCLAVYQMDEKTWQYKISKTRSIRRVPASRLQPGHLVYGYEPGPLLEFVEVLRPGFIEVKRIDGELDTVKGKVHVGVWNPDFDDTVISNEDSFMVLYEPPYGIMRYNFLH